MSDHERGAYTPPTDGPLAFEPRQPVRGARPFPLTLVVSVVVLLALAAAIFVFYRSGVRQASGPPQAVGAPVGGLKAAPPPEAQAQDAGEGLQIYRSESGQSATQGGAPKFTPPPEQPQARPQPGPAVTLVPPQQGAIQAPPPAGHVAQSALRPAQAAPSAAAAAQAQPQSAPGPSALPPAAKSAPVAAAHEALAPQTPKATATDKPKTQPVAKAEPAKAEPPKTAAAKAETSKPAASKGVAVVQIGAVSSTALADKTWNDAVAVAPGLAMGKGKAVEKVEKDGKTLYRTSVTGFASRDAAQAFCAKLKAAGKACFVK